MLRAFWYCHPKYTHFSLVLKQNIENLLFGLPGLTVTPKGRYLTLVCLGIVFCLFLFNVVLVSLFFNYLFFWRNLILAFLSFGYSSKTLVLVLAKELAWFGNRNSPSLSNESSASNNMVPLLILCYSPHTYLFALPSKQAWTSWLCLPWYSCSTDCCLLQNVSVALTCGGSLAVCVLVHSFCSRSLCLLVVHCDWGSQADSFCKWLFVFIFIQCLKSLAFFLFVLFFLLWLHFKKWFCFLPQRWITCKFFINFLKVLLLLQFLSSRAHIGNSIN